MVTSAMGQCMAVSRRAKYEVFICHRGPDVKYSFASLLKDRLHERHKIVAFLDYKDLVPGDVGSASRRAAMEGAELGIVVLSPRFFESEHCMKELDFLLRVNRILPVLVQLTADSCKAESVIAQSDRVWADCKMDEDMWRDILRRLEDVNMMPIKDWNEGLNKVVRRTAEILRRVPGPSYSCHRPP